MNIIPKLTQEHRIINNISFKYIIYLFLISDTKRNQRTKEVFSNYTVLDIVDKFSHLEELEIERIVSILENEGFLYVENDQIIVGNIVDNIVKLLNNDATSPSEFFTMLEESNRQFAISMRRNPKLYLVELGTDRINKLKNKDIDRWVLHDLMDLYRVTYESVFQEFVKDYQAKEWALMKGLIKLYETGTIVKMIIYYLHHSEKFHRTLPSIGLLIYHKNDIYSAITVTNKRNKNRHVRDDSDF